MFQPNTVLSQEKHAKIDKTIPHQINFPKKVEIVNSIPSKDNLWVFILAGQSNMAGRAFVMPEDTIPNPRILTITKDDQLVMAKSPLHYYQPKLMGLGCARSFAKEVLKNVSDSIHIALVPCAFGGTSIKQWLGDSIRKNIRLYSNTKHKIKLASEYGTIKGVLWHQGENDAKHGNVVDYKKQLTMLMQSFRNDIQDQSLPIIIGELGKNMNNTQDQINRTKINTLLNEAAQEDKNMSLIHMQDLTTHDGYHFDHKSVQIMGERYANAFLKLCKSATQKRN